MGPTLSYLNIVSIRDCVMLKEKDLFSILAQFEGRPVRYVQYFPPPNMEVVQMLTDLHFPRSGNEKKKDPDYDSEEDQDNDEYWEDIPDDELSQIDKGQASVDDDDDEEFGGKVEFATPAKKMRRRKQRLDPEAEISQIPNTNSSAFQLDEKEDREYIGELMVGTKPQKSKFLETFQTIPDLAKAHEIVVKEEEDKAIDYKIHVDRFKEILEVPNLQIERSDADILITLFKLNDKMGFGEGDIRMALVAASVVVCDDEKHCLDMAFRLYDTTTDQLYEKNDFLKIMKMLNESCLYFGDKYLPTSQIVDLVDSIYTSAGRIDGELYYPDHIDAIANHPLMELYLSPQFQGNLRLKTFSRDEIMSMNVVVRI